MDPLDVLKQLAVLQNEQSELRQRQAELASKIAKLDKSIVLLQDEINFEATPRNPAPVLPPPIPVSPQTPQTPPSPQVPPAPPAPPSQQAPPPEKSPFEFRLATYWFIRIGAVLLLIAFVSFANFLYQNFFGQLQAAGKIGLMALASVGISILGWRLESSSRNLRNFGRIIFGTGLATGYYTLFAAHYISSLRIIESPVLAGVLLILFASFIAFLADKKTSQLLAIFAFILAYFAAFINPSGFFTLVSNLILAVFIAKLLLKHYWPTLVYLSISATYAGYLRWNPYFIDEWWWRSSTSSSIPVSALCVLLCCYWGIFTFISWNLPEPTPHARRKFHQSLLITGNNASAFLFFTLTLSEFLQDHLYLLSLAIAATWGAFAFFAYKKLPNEEHRHLQSLYFVHSIIALFVASAQYFSGYQSAIAFAAQATILAWLAQSSFQLTRASRITSFIACLIATFHVFTDPEMNFTGCFMTGILLLATTWLQDASKNVSFASETNFQKTAATRISLLGIFCGLLSHASLFIGLRYIQQPYVVQLGYATFIAFTILFLFPLHRSKLIVLSLQPYLFLFLTQWLSSYGASREFPHSGLLLFICACLFSISATALSLIGHPQNKWKSPGIYFYRIAGTFLFIKWANYVFPTYQASIILAFLAFVAFMFSRGGTSFSRFLAGIFYTFFSIYAFGEIIFDFYKYFYFSRSESFIDMPFLSFFLCLTPIFLIASHLLTRQPDLRPSAQQGFLELIGLAGLLLFWLWLAAYFDSSSSLVSTGTWSLYAGAVLLLGLWVRQKSYRMTAILILGVCLIKVMLYDVWKLDSLQRMLAFLILALVLISLSFVYSRFPNLIRRLIRNPSPPEN